MFRHLDLTLREMGVQDLGVGRRIKIMAEGFQGRALAYREALAARPTPLARSCAATPMAVGRLPTPARSRLEAHVRARPTARRTARNDLIK
jgi:cytochrome b pre-mRNA-processing protein 3